MAETERMDGLQPKLEDGKEEGRINARTIILYGGIQ